MIIANRLKSPNPRILRRCAEAITFVYSLENRLEEEKRIEIKIFVCLNRLSVQYIKKKVLVDFLIL